MVTPDRHFLACGRCGFTAEWLREFTCPRCQCDVRHVGIGRDFDVHPGAAPAITRWTFFIIVIGGITVGVLFTLKHYDRHAQRYLAPLDESFRKVEITAQGSGFSKTCSLDEATVLLVGPDRRRAALFVNTRSMRYQTNDQRLRMIYRPGRLTPETLLAWMATAGVDVSTPTAPKHASEIFNVIRATRTGDIKSPPAPSFRSGGGGEGYGAGEPTEIINWVLVTLLAVWIARIAWIIHVHRRPAPETKLAEAA